MKSLSTKELKHILGLISPTHLGEDPVWKCHGGNMKWTSIVHDDKESRLLYVKNWLKKGYDGFWKNL
jgi:hypothetical protein